MLIVPCFRGEVKGVAHCVLGVPRNVFSVVPAAFHSILNVFPCDYPKGLRGIRSKVAERNIISCVSPVGFQGFMRQTFAWTPVRISSKRVAYRR